MKRRRFFLRAVSALALLLCLSAVSLIVFLRSDWLAQRFRQAIITGVADATGARAEIPSFTWDWRTLTILLRGFSMHGFEPALGPPLFTAPAIRIRLRILSLLNGNVQVASLVVQRPQFYLIVGPNGKTNIPGPKHVRSPHEIIESLVNLKLPYVAAMNGEARINDRRIPIDLAGDHVSLLIQYQQISRRYHLDLQSPQLRLGTQKASYFDGSVKAAADIWRDHCALTASHFHSRSANVRITGSLEEFNNPVVDWRVASTFQASETLRSLGIKNLESGTIALNGIGHHDPQTPLFFDGKLAGDHLSAALPGLHLREVSARTNLLVDAAKLQLTELVLSSVEGHFAGRASLTPDHALQISGMLSRLNLQTVAAVLVHKSLPWSGEIAGPIELSAVAGSTVSNTVLKGELAIRPLTNGIPVSGDISFVYRQQANNVNVQDAHLLFPHTQMTVSGTPAADVNVTIDSTDLSDFSPGLVLRGAHLNSRDLPVLAPGGKAHLQATAHLSRPAVPQIDGTLDVSRVQWKGTLADRIRSTFSASAAELRFSSLSFESPLLKSTASGQVALSSWQLDIKNAAQISGTFSGANVHAFLALLSPDAAKKLSGGSAEGSFGIRGSLARPEGEFRIIAKDITVQGQRLNVLGATLNLAENRLAVTDGQVRAGSAAAAFSANYVPSGSRVGTNSDWTQGMLQVNVDSNRFALSQFRPLIPALQDLEGISEVHAKTKWMLAADHVTPVDLAGKASVEAMRWKGVPAGDVNASAITLGRLIKGSLTGNLRGSRMTGTTELQIAPGLPATGQFAFQTLTLSSLAALLQPDRPPSAVLSGSARGSVAFDGPLENFSKLHAILELTDLQVKGPPLPRLTDDVDAAPAGAKTSADLILQSTTPVRIELSNGVAVVRSAQLTGLDTQLSIEGSAGLFGSQALQLALNGGVDLRLLQLLFPEVRIGGQSRVDARVSGTFADPQLSGLVQLTNGSVYSPLLPNGLSDLGGAIRFDQHRANLENVTAHTGGGTVHFGGFVTYSANHPLVYRLESSGQNVRIRYVNGISVTGNSQFSLTGTSDQSLLSGSISVSRIVLNPSADLGNLLASTAAPTVAADNERDYLSRLQMDIRLESAPNLQLDTALSSGIQAEIGLQLRGTPKQPIFLGSIEANQGDIKVFGSRYTITRAQVNFTNSARLEPVLDLDLQTQARGITVDITASGTLNKLNINYRSDPPLQPRDIIALLTVGRAPQATTTQSNVQSTNDASSLQAGANSVLGQAIAPVSNRLSKLFGITNIKIDPLVQGITNTPQARLTLEQQISRQITVTYITNLSQTSEQIFRLEYALNPQYSLIALRDDNGEFGVDILYKKRFK